MKSKFEKLHKSISIFTNQEIRGGDTVFVLCKFLIMCRIFWTNCRLLRPIYKYSLRTCQNRQTTYHEWPERMIGLTINKILIQNQ